MALIKCNDCGMEISDTTTECVHCGCPVKKEGAVKVPKKGNNFGNLIKKNSIAIVLIVFGVIVCASAPNEYDSVPSKEISYYGLEEYVGGDAYNYMIEASLRGGQIAGTRAANATYNLVDSLYTCSGMIIIAMGLAKLKK